MRVEAADAGRVSRREGDTKGTRGSLSRSRRRPELPRPSTLPLGPPPQAQRQRALSLTSFLGQTRGNLHHFEI